MQRVYLLLAPMILCLLVGGCKSETASPSADSPSALAPPTPEEDKKQFEESMRTMTPDQRERLLKARAAAAPGK